MSKRDHFIDHKASFSSDEVARRDHCDDVWPSTERFTQVNGVVGDYEVNTRSRRR